MPGGVSAAEALAAAVACGSAAVGRPVTVDARAVLDRGDSIALGPVGTRVSPNGSCELLRAADGWIALNLARADDRVLLPAWLEGDALAPGVGARAAATLVERAALLGLPVAALGEVAPPPEPVRSRPIGPAGEAARTVLDLSALWAGPLASAVLAAAGWRVTKVEDRWRRDPMAAGTPLAERLNGAKELRVAELRAPGVLAALAAEADVIVSAARPRAFAALGLDPAAWAGARPGRVWIAITGHGWEVPRVAFGDDAAIAGGLVGTAADGPVFAGDALADPLAGLAGAAAAFAAVAAGGGVLLDVGMARVAAWAAAR